MRFFHLVRFGAAAACALVFTAAAPAGTAGTGPTDRLAQQTSRAGATYSAQGSFRSTRPGTTLCLQVRELAGRTGIGNAASRCVVTTGRWQRISSPSLRAKRSGTRVVTGLYSKGARGAVNGAVASRSVTLSVSTP